MRDVQYPGVVAGRRNSSRLKITSIRLLSPSGGFEVRIVSSHQTVLLSLLTERRRSTKESPHFIWREISSQISRQFSNSWINNITFPGCSWSLFPANWILRIESGPDAEDFELNNVSRRPPSPMRVRRTVIQEFVAGTRCVSSKRSLVPTTF